MIYGGKLVVIIFIVLALVLANIVPITLSARLLFST